MRVTVPTADLQRRIPTALVRTAFLLCSAVGCSLASAFLFGGEVARKHNFVALPELHELTQQHEGKRLDIRLIIGDPDDTAKANLAMSQLGIELLDDDASSRPAQGEARTQRIHQQEQQEQQQQQQLYRHDDTDSDIVGVDVSTRDDDGVRDRTTMLASSHSPVKMPGADGPFRSLSSGSKVLRVLTAPSFVSMGGVHHVQLQDGCWELIWREGDIAGNLICGFRIPHTIQRNTGGVALDAGCRVYISFLVWTERRLSEHHANVAKAQRVAGELLAIKEEEMMKMEAAKMPWVKAAHFQRAMKAYDKLEAYTKHLESCSAMTPHDKDLAPMGSDMYIMKKGTIWKRDRSSVGNQHAFVGEAYARLHDHYLKNHAP